jgi:putative radical SAM enzyme (TIGR03279 family)
MRHSTASPSAAAAPARPSITMPGLLVASVDVGSELSAAGLRAGDSILAIDGLAPRDIIDVQLELPGARHIHVARDEQLVRLELGGVVADTGTLAFADPVPGGIRECNNHCEFCFIRGLPRGLRPTLYVYDDDYRYSFLWGNFLTLTNLDEADWQRIGYQRLSPLNVSVHATELDVRRRLLNNRRAPDVMPQLERLAAMAIRVHCQVVLCAGINDGPRLERTIRDLAGLHPAVQSVSVVPVGLTRHSRVKHIRRPTHEEARLAVRACEAWQTKLRPSLGVGFVYASDELYLLAGQREPPPSAAYDGFPVLSNGVGMLRSMLDDWEPLVARSARSDCAPAERRVAWLAGSLAAPALEGMADRWQRHAGWRPRVVVVANTLFGDEITVSGLLSGNDLIQALRDLPPELDDIVVPRSAFGFDGRHTLDGISAEGVGDAHPARVHLASTPAELLAILLSRASLAERRRATSGG